MNTTTAKMVIPGEMVNEYAELFAEQRRVGLTLLARLFAFKFNRADIQHNSMTPERKNHINTQREKIYNQDAELALKAVGYYLKMIMWFKILMVTSLIFGVTSLISWTRLSGLPIFIIVAISILSGLSSLMMLFDAVIDRNTKSISFYTIDLARSWKKCKKVMLYHGVARKIGEYLMPHHEQGQTDSTKKIHKDAIQKIMSDLPEIAEERYNSAFHTIKEILTKDASRILGYQKDANLSEEKKIREKMEQLCRAAEMLDTRYQFHSGEAISDAFKTATKKLRESIENPKS